MIRRPALTLLLVLVLVPGTVMSSTADGNWMKNVPARAHEEVNPYRGQGDAIAAGRRIFVDRCSHCHGEDAEGTKKRPPLTSERIQHQASEGDLHWLLVNGNMRKGMPSWSKLPDQQLWQVISYLKSLRP
jgi:cytochrome c oxidase cbb3-type subunit 3